MLIIYEVMWYIDQATVEGISVPRNDEILRSMRGMGLRIARANISRIWGVDTKYMILLLHVQTHVVLWFP